MGNQFEQQKPRSWQFSTGSDVFAATSEYRHRVCSRWRSSSHRTQCWHAQGVQGFPGARRLTFASGERGDLPGPGSDVVDDGILEPGDPEEQHNMTGSPALPSASTSTTKEITTDVCRRLASCLTSCDRRMTTSLNCSHPNRKAAAVKIISWCCGWAVKPAVCTERYEYSAAGVGITTDLTIQFNRD